MFGLFLGLGFEHILDFAGYDHILFVIILCIAYKIKEFKKILVLITAFTLGHTITLFLATFEYVFIPSEIIELLIALTIFFSAIYNIFDKSNENIRNLNVIKYFSAFFFGLIHGLGFSIQLRSLLSNSEDIISSLFAFNIGLEFGQMFIVAGALGFTWLFVEKFNVKHRFWIITVSCIIGIISGKLVIERLIVLL